MYSNRDRERERKRDLNINDHKCISNHMHIMCTRLKTHRVLKHHDPLSSSSGPLSFGSWEFEHLRASYCNSSVWHQWCEQQRERYASLLQNWCILPPTCWIALAMLLRKRLRIAPFQWPSATPCRMQVVGLRCSSDKLLMNAIHKYVCNRVRVLYIHTTHTHTHMSG